METLARLASVEKRSLLGFPDSRRMYEFAEAHVRSARSAEFDKAWSSILDASRRPIDEHWFMREYVWCAHVAGFSAARVSKFYDRLLAAHNVEDGDRNYIPITAQNLIDTSNPGAAVFSVWKNRAKARAVQGVRRMLLEDGWEKFSEKYLAGRSPERISGLPFMGKALSCHLARNLGNLGIVKPDVHLNRLAREYGYADALSLCRDVSPEPAGRTDLVLWFASVDHGTR